MTQLKNLEKRFRESRGVNIESLSNMKKCSNSDCNDIWLPATLEFFRRDNKSGKLYSKCKRCTHANRRKRDGYKRVKVSKYKSKISRHDVPDPEVCSLCFEKIKGAKIEELRPTKETSTSLVFESWYYCTDCWGSRIVGLIMG